MTLNFLTCNVLLKKMRLFEVIFNHCVNQDVWVIVVDCGQIVVDCG